MIAGGMVVCSQPAGETSAALVVSSNPLTRRTCTELLALEGLEVLTATSGNQALELLEDSPVELSMFDLSSIGDGFEALQRIRSDHRFSDLPVVVVTEALDESLFDQCRAIDVCCVSLEPNRRLVTRLNLAHWLRRYRRQARTRQALGQLTAMSEAVQDAVILLDEDNAIACWSGGAPGMFDRNASAARSQALTTLVIPEGYHQEYENALTTIRDTGHGTPASITIELEARRLTGQQFPIELSLVGTLIGERWFTIVVIRDISERMHLREEQKMRERMELDLRHSQKLEAVGQLAAGIAHEINTPTQFVSDSIHFLLSSLHDQWKLIDEYGAVVKVLESRSEYRALLDQIRLAEEQADLEFIRAQAGSAAELSLEGLNRIATIVRSMKEFAHADERQKQPADINRALRNTLNIAKNEYKYVADVEWDLGDLPEVPCHIGDLNQVFLNLVVNAAHAIGEKNRVTKQSGVITIRTRSLHDKIRIEISDTGGGIPETVRDRIFEPFFTTKEVGKGTGQGLAIARSLVVNKHGGKLTFDTVAGQGTTFIIELPTAAREPMPGEVVA